jgi:hypothetical protein
MAIFKDINEESLTEFHNCFFLLEGLGLYWYVVGSPIMSLRNLDAQDSVMTEC